MRLLSERDEGNADEMMSLLDEFAKFLSAFLFFFLPLEVDTSDMVIELKILLMGVLGTLLKHFSLFVSVRRGVKKVWQNPKPETVAAIRSFN